MLIRKSSKLWIVNIVSFALLMVLSGTGLVNWLILPKGFEARGSFLVSLRHSLIVVHEWTALMFIFVVAIHISLHWQYVKSNMSKKKS